MAGAGAVARRRREAFVFAIVGGMELVTIFKDYRLKAGRILWRLKVALRLKPPEALPA